MNDFKRSLNRFDLIEAKQGTSDTTVKADDSFINNSTKREPFKHLVDFIEDGVDILRFFTETTRALLGETEGSVDPSILVVSSQQMDLLWELYFEGHQETNSLK